MPRNYVDNAFNRSAGRVGMPLGSMVISSGSSAGGSGGGGGGGGGYGGGYGGGSLFSDGGGGYGGGSSYSTGFDYSFGASSSNSSSSQKTYVDNAYNRQHGRAGLPFGSAVISKSGSSEAYGNSSSSSQKTYVDNAYNRQHGRAGLPFGSSVISKSGSSASGDSRSSSSQKTYVDNAYNRQHGRAGLPFGSSVISKSGSSTSGDSRSSSSQKTYVDNSYNRQHGRAGLPVGSAVISKSGSSGDSGGRSSQKTYVDNAYNRQHGRAGLPIGDAVISKSKPSVVYQRLGTGASVKVYKDNTLNRSLGRVGKPLGTCVHSRKGNSDSGSKKSCEPQLYVDNSENRRLGRVGKPRGSMPNSRVSKTTENARDLKKRLEEQDFNDDYGDEFSEMEIDLAVSEINRRLEELAWYKRQERQGQQRSKVMTSSAVLEQYKGLKIDFDEIKLGKIIGKGGFGDVYFATWNSSVVAVKKLRVQRVSKKRLKDFTKEVMAFCDLEHPNIVRFIGACLKTPNIAIVMEYMQISLFTALHMSEDEVEFTEDERLSILRQTACGLQYLHDNRIAHCDLKSHNILLDYEPGETCVAKITDFGLSMVKSDSESSVSAVEQVRNIGTPRYSAPEVLRGEMLSAEDMMQTDIYSFALIMFEVIYEEEPYYNLGYAQLQKQVGVKGVTPEIPESPNVSIDIRSLMKECWDYIPSKRPEMGRILSILNEHYKLFVETYTSY